MFWNQLTLRLKTQSCVNKKSLLSQLDSSSKQWWKGANWPIIGPNRRIIHHIMCTHIWLNISVHLSVVIRRFILWWVSNENKAFSMLRECSRFFVLKWSSVVPTDYSRNTQFYFTCILYIMCENTQSLVFCISNIILVRKAKIVHSFDKGTA